MGYRLYQMMKGLKMFNFKDTNMKEFKTIYPEWKTIPVGLCGWNWEEGGYLDDNLDNSYGNMETYSTVGRAIKVLSDEAINRSFVTYSFDEDGKLNYFHLATTIV